MKHPAGFAVVVLVSAMSFQGFLAGEPEPAAQQPPDSARLVALVFPGPCSNYATFVAPLLKKYHFGATFCVDDAIDDPLLPLMRKDQVMNWTQIKKLSSYGFEIGNATANYRDGSISRSKSKLIPALGTIEQLCSANGIPKPTMFYYPDGFPSSAAVQVLADRGYLIAVDCRSGLTYEPARDHPLLTPGAWFYGHEGEREKFFALLGSLRPGQIPVLVFDGIETRPGGTQKSQFKEYMKFLADNHFTVVSMRDLAAHANPGEAMHATRLWRRTGDEWMQAMAAAAKASRQQKVVPTGLEKQLEGLIIPKIDFKEASPGSVLEFLRQKVATISNGSLQPSFVLERGVDFSMPVTLHLSNAPVMEILRYLSDLTDTEFVVDEYAVSVKSKTNLSPPETIKMPADPVLTKGLESLILPSVNFNQCSLGTVLDALSQKAGALSGGKEVPDFVIEPGMDTSTPVSLRLLNAPFTEVLLYLGDVAGADFEMDRYAISVKRKSRERAKTPATRQQMQTLQTLIIPDVHFKETSLESALEFLRQKTVSISGGSVQPCFVIDPRLNASTPVTLDLANIPFTEVLRYLGDFAGAEFIVERYAISVRRKDAPIAHGAATPFALVK